MSGRARLRLECRGVVQGVGFRPYVHRLARRLALSGQVANVQGAVVVELNGCRLALERFVDLLPLALPGPAHLEPLRPIWLPDLPAGAAVVAGVRLVAAAAQPLGIGLVAPALAPDLAPCPACRAELADPANRRHGYAFISCSACGPRYSIATAEPFARAHTTLAGFPLCEACRREFDDPDDRRFHAETIGCPTCGPRLQLLEAEGEGTPSGNPIGRAVALLKAGWIVALQGVGGFQLLVDATNANAVARLRQRKGRPSKPLAVLVADPAWVAPWARISAAERCLLASPAAPIVLLRRRRHGPAAGHQFRAATTPPLAAGLAPGSAELGVMLPASPLHLLVVEAFGAPLVATSGNRSGEPLCICPQEAQRRLLGQADAFLVHNRPIARGLDDSVLRCIAGQPALVRRARGFAPQALVLPAWGSRVRPVLALGGDLNSAPALAVGRQVWLAPHQGDLADALTQQRWQQGLEELIARHGPQLETICSDRHPEYISVQWAQAVAPPQRHRAVPHHLAHGLAVLAEHGVAPPALVVAFDGLGYGDLASTGELGPAPLWGGEGLLIDADRRCQRLLSLRPFALPGGARAMREPRRAALGLLAALGERAWLHPGAAATRAAFSAGSAELLLQAIASGCQSPYTSSVGRLFDAVASLLGLAHCLSFEGEGGLLVQGVAEQAGADRVLPMGYPLPLRRAPAAAGVPNWLDWQPLLEALLADRAAGVAVPLCALRLHRALVQGLTRWAVSAQPGPLRVPVVLAGGCFQNRLLLEGAIAALAQRGRRPLWAQQLPCGDGGLALGQLVAAS